MKSKAALLVSAFVFIACTREVIREVAHDAAIAEEAIEKDMETHPYHRDYNRSFHPCDSDEKSINNHRQYPERVKPKRGNFEYGCKN